MPSPPRQDHGAGAGPRGQDHGGRAVGQGQDHGGRTAGVGLWGRGRTAAVTAALGLLLGFLVVVVFEPLTEKLALTFSHTQNLLDPKYTEH